MNDLLLRIKLRREQALEDSDANLARLLYDIDEAINELQTHLVLVSEGGEYESK